MYFELFNKKEHTFTINSWRIATPVSGLLSGKRYATPIMPCMTEAALLKPISLGLLRGPATTASGGRGSHPKVLSMGWIYLSHQKSGPEHCTKKSTTW
jgi:hypothetical protein